MAFESDYKFDELKPLREKNNDEYTPDEQQIHQYAKYIGITLPSENYMIGLAKEGVMASLPDGWQACQTAQGQLVYRNLYTKAIQQEHPMDEVYRQKVIELRQAYENYEVSYESELNTIIQEKSEQKSENSEKIEESLLPSLTLKQQLNSELEMAGNILGSKQKGVSINLHKGKLNDKKVLFDQNGTKFEMGRSRNVQKELLKQKLGAQLEQLHIQQRLTAQLLKQIKQSNSLRFKKIIGAIKSKERNVL